jgi:hypothetical protein
VVGSFLVWQSVLFAEGQVFEAFLVCFAVVEKFAVFVEVLALFDYTAIV